MTVIGELTFGQGQVPSRSAERTTLKVPAPPRTGKRRVRVLGTNASTLRIGMKSVSIVGTRMIMKRGVRALETNGNTLRIGVKSVSIGTRMILQRRARVLGTNGSTLRTGMKSISMGAKMLLTSEVQRDTITITTGTGTGTRKMTSTSTACKKMYSRFKLSMGLDSRDQPRLTPHLLQMIAQLPAGTDAKGQRS